MATGNVLRSNGEENAIRSSSVDSAIFDGGEDSTDEIDDGEEESFDELNDENLCQSQYKRLICRLIRYGCKRLPIIQFTPKVVYDRCSRAEEMGEKCHLTFKFVKNETKLIRNILEGHGFREVHPSSCEFNLLWTGGGMKPFTLRSLQPFQRVNHFPRSYEMTRKDRLYKNLQKMQQEKGLKNFNFIPTTFLLPYEFEDFSSAFQREKGVWIIKPVASSQGKGIFLINHPDQVPLDENLVISRYIDNPLLIDGYKFDVRIYVAVTSYDPLVAYLYEEGLTRFATVKYEANSRSIKNAFMHLTNYSVNKRSHRYVRCDDPEIEDFGNKWSMSAMLRLLKAEGKDTFTLMMAIEDVVIKTLLSVESQISAACRMFLPTRGNCFEVYGFDILIDDDLKPWVLEVNLSPSLACDAPIDLKIKSHMICDLLNLCSFPWTDPSIYFNKQRQQKSDSSCQSDQMKRRRPISAGYSLTSSLTNTNCRQSRAKTANRTTTIPNRQETSERGEYFGLSSEETKILRTVKEENRQRGGFVRIFPTRDTFEFFSMFFEQRTTSFNQMIHQRLYPSRWGQNSFNFQQSSCQMIRRTTVPRSKHLSLAFHSSDKDNQIKLNGSDIDEALERYRIYERRLVDLIPPSTSTTLNQLDSNEIQSKVVQQNVSSFNNRIETDKMSINRRISIPIEQLNVKQQSNDFVSKRLSNVTQIVKQQISTGEGRHSIYAKNDLLQMFNEGFTLSPIQARTAFATYLQRIQIRLMLDSELKEDVTSTQHMELVLRFLKRAGRNLSPLFRVEIPSRRLSIGDQKRILAKQLADFLHLYNKETSILNCQSSTTTIDQKLFETFLRSACESDLEEIMTNYMKTNVQSSIHLGVHPKTTKSNFGQTKMAFVSHSNDSNEEKEKTSSTNFNDEKSIRPIETICGCSSTSDRESLVKTSSATKQRNSQEHRVYGISRPLSAVVQHKKQLTATGSSVPGTKLLTRERPNSANICGEQANRDFAEQLNEISSKQHRRQYSAVHHLNVLHNRSLSLDQSSTPIDQQITKELSKEEEILEKSRQMIEQSETKNELLAEQAKVFQRTLQRNEIYSALNRFSHRPTIYPNLIKENRNGQNRFQQLRNPLNVPLLADQHRIKSTTNSSQD